MGNMQQAIGHCILLVRRKAITNNMKTSRHNIIVLSTAFAICIGIFFIGRSHSAKQRFSSRVFRVAEKWGYEILVNDSVFIRQESIPAMNGRSGFDSPEQATQTAALIINKMERGRAPTVTTFEIQQICAPNTTTK
jgi:hypothetical protein